jgi:type IV secretory pathway TrbL component
MLEKEQLEKFFVDEIKIIQDIIKRMAFNSFMIKGWAITLVIVTLLLRGNKYQVLIAFIPLLIFGFWMLIFYGRKECIGNCINGLLKIDLKLMKFFQYGCL